MKRIINRILVVALIGGAAAGGYFFAPTIQQNISSVANAAAINQSQGAQVETQSAVAQTAANLAIKFDARLVPVKESKISLNTSGVVAEVLVEEGQSVEAGQVILRLEASQQRVAIAQAQANLQRAQATLDKMKAGARAEEIAQSQASLDVAQARYDRTVNSSVPGEAASARASLVAAQANYAKVTEGASEDTLIAARASLASAEAKLRSATSKYNEVKWRSDIGMLQQSLDLEQATVAYEQAKATLANLEAGATQASIAQANAQIQQADAQLQQAKNAESGNIAEVDANLRLAQASLDLLKAGNRPEDIAAAEADVAATTAQLQSALVSLNQAELKAPMAGTIAQLNVSVGEQVSPGIQVARLADLTAWQIETSDLTELDVVGITPNTQVGVTFDALPGNTIAGKVKLVKPVGEDDRGDVVYTVVIIPETQDARWLWNMSAKVSLSGS